MISLTGRTSLLLGIALSMPLLQRGVGQTVSVLTQHNDLSRSGANPNEKILNTSNVNESLFGKILSLPIDGFTYAQPLYVPAVSIPGQGTHNIVYVATAHDSVYAFDADSGAQLWRVSLGTSVLSAIIHTSNIKFEVGVISTPVIDPATGTLYAVAKTYENSVQVFRLHALDIATGEEKFGGPEFISASVAGMGVQSVNGRVPFVASQENQRPALTLVNGIVYVAFASHEDHDPYHGWLLGYNASTLQRLQTFNVTPNGGEGAIWMGGQGLVADASNNLYLITANSTQSTENSAGDYGESFLKIIPSGNSLTVADYFKPNDYDYLNANDFDLGSTGAFAIPGTTYIAGGSKSGMFYVVDTNNMGKLDLSADQVVQEFQADSGLWGSPAFWNNTVYLWGATEPLKAYQFTGGLFNTSPSSQSAYSTPIGETSGSVSVSSNGTTQGTAIVWATAPVADPDGETVGGNLYAFDAGNLSSLLWSTSANPTRDSYGNYAKFVAPTVVNGKVYVGTDSEQLAVYGLLSGVGCTPTIITPYVKVNTGALLVMASTNVPSGANVTLDPRPLNGGKWSWTGPNGFTSTSRQISGIPLNPGSNVFEATYTNAIGCVSQQQFSITDGSPTGDLIPNGVYVITNLRSGLAIDNPSGSGALNAQVRQWTVNDATEQQWVVNNLGSNVIVLTNVLSGLALGVRAGSTANGALIEQESYQGLTSQQWTVTSVPGRAFELTSVNGSLALETYAGGTPWGSETLGEVLDQFSYSGGAWQQWRFAIP